MIAFGAVPSRRLGNSLGINNIPAKHCSYSCLYCQVGATHRTEVTPRTFYRPEVLYEAVHKHVEQLQQRGESIDYLTFVPDGEPTLDVNLAKSIHLLRQINIPIAVISNASLIWRTEVRRMLAQADWVSLKVDSVNEKVWRHINRPNAALDLAEILSGIEIFSQSFNGFMATETMLLDKINTSDEDISALTDFLQQLNPDMSYLAVPTRPMTEKNNKSPDADKLNHIFQTVSERVDKVELLSGYEGDAMASSGNFIEDILAITAVHPMREDQVTRLLEKTKSDRSVLAGLLKEGRLRQVDYNGNTFYLRSFERK